MSQIIDPTAAPERTIHLTFKPDATGVEHLTLKFDGFDNSLDLMIALHNATTMLLNDMVEQRNHAMQQIQQAHPKLRNQGNYPPKGRGN